MTDPIPGDGCAYCAGRRCPGGHPFSFHRPGSVGTGPDGNLVDAVALLCFGREHHIVLCFDMYHGAKASRIPEDPGTGEPTGRGTAHLRFRNFPDQADGYGVARVPNIPPDVPQQLLRPRFVVDSVLSSATPSRPSRIPLATRVRPWRDPAATLRLTVWGVPA